MVCCSTHVGCVCSSKDRVSYCRPRQELHRLTIDRFKGAYCTVWEHEPLLELFGEMDVVADTLPEMAEKVMAASS